MINFLYFLILVLSLNNLTFAMEKKPYHHLSDGTFRNPEGSPKRDPNVKWSYKIFNQDNVLCTTAKTRHAFVNAETRKIMRCPATFLNALGN